MHIIQLWENHATGPTLTASCADLARRAGLDQILISSLGRWHNGKRRVPDCVHREMLRELEPVILKMVRSGHSLAEVAMPPATTHRGASQ